VTHIEQIAGRTFHGRRGDVGNRFSYGVDYLLLNPDAVTHTPWPLRRNRAGLVSQHDSDHGGPPGQGRGVAWVRELLADFPAVDGDILLLAQPRVLGHVFNPVSFWLCHDHAGALRLVIAEVSNTYGDRHSYLCHHDDLRPITAAEDVGAAKIFYVSPFQPVEGDYRFRFDITPAQINIRIDYHRPDGGLIATLTGARRRVTTRSLLGAALRRPLGSRRVLALIHWQALKLWWKGARFRPHAPKSGPEVSR
jgi:DUF1365 family protein